MRNSSGNIAQDMERIIRETFRLSQPQHILPPFIHSLNLKKGYGLVAIGKAAVSMAETFLQTASTKPEIALVLTAEKYMPEKIHNGIILMKGEHPYPGPQTFQSSKKILNFLQKTIPETGQIILLLSGGGSSLFEIPRQDVSPGNIQHITRSLMLKGADIHELNTVRKHLSDIKGGRLARHLYPREITALIMSDVMGDPLDFIASGPVTPDTTTAEDARRILKKYDLNFNVIRDDSEKDRMQPFTHVRTRIIANNATLLENCTTLLKKSGIPVINLSFPLAGEASECGQKITDTIKALRQHTSPPFFLAGGGETHVTVKGDGLGGRNMELALWTALSLKNEPFAWTITSAGSDGIDGPTDAAGAILSHHTLQKEDTGIILSFLRNNDSYSFLNKRGFLIKTGYTGINLNDLFVAQILS